MLGFGVVVLHWPVRDSAGLGCVEEGTIVLGKVLVGRMQTGYHASKSISADALPEEAGQFGVSIGNVDAARIPLPVC